jgi:hypothetical protein
VRVSLRILQSCIVSCEEHELLLLELKERNRDSKEKRRTCCSQKKPPREREFWENLVRIDSLNVGGVPSVFYIELDGQDQLLLISSNGWSLAWGARMINGCESRRGQQEESKGGIYTWAASLKKISTKGRKKKPRVRCFTWIIWTGLTGWCRYGLGWASRVDWAGLFKE